MEPKKIMIARFAKRFGSDFYTYNLEEDYVEQSMYK